MSYKFDYNPELLIDINLWEKREVPLLEAIENGKIDLIKASIIAGADVNAKSALGTPLDIAFCADVYPKKFKSGIFSTIEIKRIQVVSMLLEAGATPDAAGIKNDSLSYQHDFDDKVITPLRMAIKKRDFDLAKLLIKHGTTINKKIIPY